jgi:hypothetical protein
MRISTKANFILEFSRIKLVFAIFLTIKALEYSIIDPRKDYNGFFRIL